MEADSQTSPAYQRFIRSTKISYNDWHDGAPYDMQAFAELSQAERDAVVEHLTAGRGPAFDWRDLEVFQAAATPKSIAVLQAAMRSSSGESRLRSAVALNEMGIRPDYRNILAIELGRVTITDGMSYALDLIEKPSTAEIRDALLRGVRERPEVAVHYAAMLCYLAGKADSEFDWSMRPFFLRFGEHASAEDRAAAYHELCEMLGV